jgi:ATP-dependent helicase/nuclease subunit A
LASQAAQKIGLDLQRGDSVLKVIGDPGDDTAAPASRPGTKSVALPDWLSRPAPSDTRVPLLIRPFEAAGGDEPPVFSPLQRQKRFSRGLIVHTLLAHLPQIEPSRRAAKAQSYLRALKFPPEEIADLTAEILAVLDDPVFAPAFGPQSRSEVAIVADLPELGAAARVNGRIDRLSLSEEEILIVDFKTNRPPPKSEAEVPTLYATQMSLYRAAAAKVFPNRRIVCGLLWTDGPTLMRLSDVFLDRQMRQIRARLDPEGARS